MGNWALRVLLDPEFATRDQIEQLRVFPSKIGAQQAARKVFSNGYYRFVQNDVEVFAPMKFIMGVAVVEGDA